MRVGLFYRYLFPGKFPESGDQYSDAQKAELEEWDTRSLSLRQRIKMSTAMKIGRSFRIPSAFLRLFKDRPLLIVASRKALAIAKQYQLDIIHTQTEFSLGLWECGLDASCDSSHSYLPYPVWGTMSAILREVWSFAQVWSNTLWQKLYEWSGWRICPSEIVYDLLQKYKVKAENALFRQGLIWPSLTGPEITPTEKQLLFVKIWSP